MLVKARAQVWRQLRDLRVQPRALLEGYRIRGAIENEAQLSCHQHQNADNYADCKHTRKLRRAAIAARIASMQAHRVDRPYQRQYQ
jgi:hypothetical protein